MTRGEIMARITTVDLAEARSRLRHRTAGYDARAPYREAIANLADSRMLELELDAGESMRALRLNIARASKEVNRLVDYGVSAEGTLLVWLADKPKKTRGPRRRKEAAGEA
jgi:hypothetical protein